MFIVLSGWLEEGAFCSYVAYLFGVRRPMLRSARHFVPLDEPKTAEPQFVAMRNL